MKSMARVIVIWVTGIVFLDLFFLAWAIIEIASGQNIYLNAFWRVQLKYLLKVFGLF